MNILVVQSMDVLGVRLLHEPARLGFCRDRWESRAGLEVMFFDQLDEGPKPELARALRASYHTGCPVRLRRSLTASGFTV
jgi:hypothetical protein